MNISEIPLYSQTPTLNISLKNLTKICVARQNYLDRIHDYSLKSSDKSAPLPQFLMNEIAGDFDWFDTSKREEDIASHFLLLIANCSTMEEREQSLYN